MIPVRKFIRICHQQAGILKIADSSGKELTGRKLLIGALVFRHFFHRAIFSNDEKYVGVLLPPNIYTTIVNAALTLDKRVSINLNYTVSNEIMNKSIETAGIKHIITSRKFLDKLNYHDLNAELVVLEEDVGPKISWSDKIKGVIEAYSPCWFVDWLLGLNSISPDDVLTIIFTSGSTGVPKGVMLTHDNIGSNIDSFMNLERIDWPDILMGIMPTFHAFGFIVNIWVVLTKRVRAVYHYSPLEPKVIGKLTKKYQCTAMIATPTFYRMYIRKCEPDDLKSIEIPVAGGEHMPIEVMDAFEAKFGARPLEGFGATECSPVVCANILERRRVHKDEILRKDGSIGLPVPGVLVEIRDIDTGKVLGANEVGMMWVKGRNVMKGYLNMPEKTAEVIKDGWYCTGDLAKIDEDGFIYITGRLSRFSKIGGEMVPHEGIEKAIGDIIGITPDEPLSVVVSSIPSDKKGEKVIVMYTDLKGKTPEEIVAAMHNNNIPPIWIPSIDAFVQVEKIPILGTGKLDIQGAKNLALKVMNNEN